MVSVFRTVIALVFYPVLLAIPYFRKLSIYFYAIRSSQRRAVSWRDYSLLLQDHSLCVAPGQVFTPDLRTLVSISASQLNPALILLILQ